MEGAGKWLRRGPGTRGHEELAGPLNTGPPSGSLEVVGLWGIAKRVEGDVRGPNTCLWPWIWRRCWEQQKQAWLVLWGLHNGQHSSDHLWPNTVPKVLESWRPQSSAWKESEGVLKSGWDWIFWDPKYDLIWFRKFMKCVMEHISKCHGTIYIGYTP